MEFEHQYEEIIIRYLLGEGSADDDQFVREWISKSEVNRLYFDQLSKLVKLVAVKNDVQKINVGEEWKLFQERRSAAKDLRLIEDSTEYILPAQTTAKDKGKLVKILLGSAVAAAILIFVLFQLQIFSPNKIKQDVVANKGSVIEKEILVHEVNTAASTKSFSLPDGSLIKLFAKSELTYREPLNEKVRSVAVSGAVDFNVAKDKNRPFIVISGPISTTAIGTVFTVICRPGARQIYVRLKEGKVVVKLLNRNDKRMKDTFLEPGQELVYDRTKGTAQVVFFNRKSISRLDNSGEAKDNPLAPTGKKKSWFMFNNQSLAKIFNTLEGMYSEEIDYEEADVNKLYFIGTFNKSDSLEYILKQIASVNNLTVRRESNGFKIEKKTAS